MTQTSESVAEAQRNMHEVLIMLAAPLADQVRRALDVAVQNGDAEAIRREGHEWSGQVGLAVLKLADAVEENPVPTDPMPLTLRNRLALALARAAGDKDNWREHVPNVDAILAAYGTNGDVPPADVTQPSEYTLTFGSVGDSAPVPPITLSYESADQFTRAVVAHAKPYLQPALEAMGRPEVADCIFRVNPERTRGDFLWISFQTGKSVHFCLTIIEAA